MLLSGYVRNLATTEADIAAAVFEAADGPDDEFVFGLDRILDGVGALVSRLRLVEVVARSRVGHATSSCSSAGAAAGSGLVLRTGPLCRRTR